MAANNRKLLEKKLLYRSTHRGCKETDIIIGDFVSANIETLSDKELAELQTLIELNDATLYSWFCDNTIVPEEWHDTVLDKLLKFNKERFDGK